MSIYRFLKPELLHPKARELMKDREPRIALELTGEDETEDGSAMVFATLYAGDEFVGQHPLEGEDDIEILIYLSHHAIDAYGGGTRPDMYPDVLRRHMTVLDSWRRAGATDLIAEYEEVLLAADAPPLDAPQWDEILRGCLPC